MKFDNEASSKRQNSQSTQAQKARKRKSTQAQKHATAKYRFDVKRISASKTDYNSYIDPTKNGCGHCIADAAQHLRLSKENKSASNSNVANQGFLSHRQNREPRYLLPRSWR